MASSQYELSSPNFIKNIQKTYRNLYLKSKFTDVTIVTEDNDRFNAHQFLLSASSEMFERIFMNIDQTSPIVFLNGVKGLMVKYLLKYIYLGEVSVEHSDIESFMQSMKDFKINSFQKSEFIEKKSNEEIEEGEMIEYKDKKSSEKRNESIGQQIDKIETKDENSSETSVPEAAQDYKLMKVELMNDIDGEDFDFDDKKAYTKNGNVDYWKLKEPIQCNECEYKTYRKSCMKSHIINKHQKHLKDRFPCEQCGQTYSSKGALKLHINSIHSGLKELVYCKIENCSFSCFRNQWMKVHENQVHNLGSKLSCEQCDYQTGNKQAFKNHLRIQHSDFKYECESCDYKCRDSDRLKDHKRIVHENILIPCELCDYKATKKSNLRDHMQVKHIKNMLNCETCDFKTIHKRKLWDHNRIVHGKESYFTKNARKWFSGK